MNILGIDASTSCSGWAVLTENGELVASGKIKTKGNSWREKIAYEVKDFCRLIDLYKPSKIIMEDVPLKDGKLTLIKLGAVQGAIIGLASLNNIGTEFLTPSIWRRKLDMFDGTREGTHRDVLKEKAVKKANELFSLNLRWESARSSKNDDDEAEAILIAYSHIFGKNK